MRAEPPQRIVRLWLRWKKKFKSVPASIIRTYKSFTKKPKPRTAGEAAFEMYLMENRIRFAYERKVWGKKKRPDYTFRYGWCRRIIVDVKDVMDDEPEPGAGGAYDPYAPLRAKINAVREQFREFKGNSCAVVFYCAGLGDADLKSPEIMLGAMYGNYGITIPFNPERGDFIGTEAETGFLTGGSVIHRNRMNQQPRIQNTTISALVTLREVHVGRARLAEHIAQLGNELAWRYDPALHRQLNVEEMHYGLIVWENVYAATPLPEGIFKGPYDEHWRKSEDGMANVQTYVGDGLRWTQERYPDAVSPFNAQ